MSRPALEVAQIFSRHGPEYRKNHRLNRPQRQAMRDIEQCRTARLGGHLDVCSRGCGYLAISYNSCRNRHCPKCQSLKQARWLAARRERLLPIRYFHLVVTLPHDLQPLARGHPELVYNLLFEAASRALLQLARDYGRLRAQIGFTAVLHTWDQDLNFHPHLHLVVTGGGLSLDGDRWIAARNSYLIPVKALSKIIRGKFLEALKKAWQEGKLQGRVPKAQFPSFLRKLRRLPPGFSLPQPLHPPGGHLQPAAGEPGRGQGHLPGPRQSPARAQKAGDSHCPGVHPPLSLARSPAPIRQNPPLRPHGSVQCQNQTGKGPDSP
jgi:hypothetical protein